MEKVKTKIDKQYQYNDRMYSLLVLLGDNYIKNKTSNGSILIDNMLSYYESNEEYERCAYLLETKEKLKNI